MKQNYGMTFTLLLLIALLLAFCMALFAQVASAQPIVEIAAFERDESFCYTVYLPLIDTNKTSGGGGTSGEENPLRCSIDYLELDRPTPEGAALEFLSQMLEQPIATLEYKSSSFAVWPNGAMGCEIDGEVYSQLQVNGYAVSIEHEGATYQIHVAAADLRAKFCSALGAAPTQPTPAAFDIEL